MQGRAIFGALAACGLLAAAAPAANATAPGGNGPLISSGTEGIYSINPDNTGYTKVLDLGPGNWADSVTASADGKSFAFYGQIGDDRQVFSATVGGGIQKVGEFCADEPSISPDGTKVAYNQATYMNGCIADADHPASGRIASAGGGAGAQFETGTTYDHAWAPDSQRLAYASGAALKVTGIGTITVVSGGLYGIDWSPDGTKLAYGGGDQMVHIIDVSGANDHVFAKGIWPKWSPDGTMIAYWNPFENTTVRRLDGSCSFSLPTITPDTWTVGSAPVPACGDPGPGPDPTPSPTPDPPQEPRTYVAMGDSYQAGEGAQAYLDPTDSRSNKCHRSANAYPSLLVADGTMPPDWRFVACSGAVIADLTNTGSWNEPPQVAALDDRTAVTTLGIGGNDVGFADILKGCLAQSVTPFRGACQPKLDQAVTDGIHALQTPDPATGLNRLQQAYRDVLTRAPDTRLFVLGYPRFFAPDGGWDFTSIALRSRRCQTLRISDQLWMNLKIHQLDSAIAASVRSMGGDYVDIYDAGDGHELCGDLNPRNDFLFGIVPWPSAVLASFHPTQLGHQLIAQRLREVMLSTEPSATRMAVSSFTVEPDQAALNVVAESADATLRAPSGRVIKPTARAGHKRVFRVRRPEAGRWRLDGGGKKDADAFTEPEANTDPRARIALSARGRTVTGDARASSDPDGSVVEYLWEWGDGELSTGRTATHRYDKPGDYDVTLVVKDDRGGLGFAAAKTLKVR